MKILINGIGRIGKLIARELLEKDSNLKLVFINDINGDAETQAHLLEFDSIHGQWDKKIKFNKNKIKIGSNTLFCYSENELRGLPIREFNIDIAIDCTGKNKTTDQLNHYFNQGVKKVLVSAPISEKSQSIVNLVYGVNHHIYNPNIHNIITAASCTTNSIAPIILVLKKEFGIESCCVTTIHDVTNTQVIADIPKKDLRRSRSSINNLIPTTTGSAKAITLIYPELEGKIDEVNKMFEKYSQKILKGILSIEKRPLVSSDFLNNPNSVIIDTLSTMVVNKKLLKVFGWYDNEYAMR